jgi:hypothetical protein
MQVTRGLSILSLLLYTLCFISIILNNQLFDPYESSFWFVSAHSIVGWKKIMHPAKFLMYQARLLNDIDGCSYAQVPRLMR